jgi:hypothetical protein
MLWSLKIMVKDQHPSSTHKWIGPEKKVSSKEYFCFRILFQLTPPNLRSSKQPS